MCILLLVVSIGGEVEKGRAYRALYASEIEDLKNTNLSTEAFDQNLGEFKHVRSVSICLAQCLDVPNCLSFQWNKITMLCRLFSISVAEALPHGIQNGNRYFSVLKDGCRKYGYIFNHDTNLCWKPFSAKLNYSNALQACQNDRGRLLRISSFQIMDYLRTELAEHSMSLFWIQGSTNGTHVINDDGTVSEFMSQAAEEAGEMDPYGRFIIAKQQGFFWMNVNPESQNGFLCQVASKFPS
uniref:Uncharacterized protein LOC111123018 n=1 Tax=Crassostrea virginica TaxID=6565 RepID=A0A8B8CYB9_CRAVI|nr:uncharacterized protein LOC111123018 [Crassostrea virginica]